MIEVKEAKSYWQRRSFVEFPNKLYKGNPYFVPPFYGDEMKLFTSKNPYANECDSVFFLAYDNKKVVGRISGIIQKQYNALHNEKRVRFTRFDAIDSQEVAHALFNAVISWAKQKGMDTICGPLGYSDIEREGLLIEGFDQLSTFNEQYNFDYYQKLIENEGLNKEIDWVESKIYPPKVKDERIERIANISLRLGHLHIVKPPKSKTKYLNQIKDGFFDCLYECYKDIYGVVPYTEKTKKQIISQAKLIINSKFLIVVCDKDEKVVASALCFPCISKPIQKSHGHLTLPCLLRLLKTIKHPEIVELGLIAVLPKYRATGVNAVFLNGMFTLMDEMHIDHYETNLNLETNTAVRNQWKEFNSIEHKRRRSFIKSI